MNLSQCSFSHVICLFGVIIAFVETLWCTYMWILVTVDCVVETELNLDSLINFMLWSLWLS